MFLISAVVLLAAGIVSSAPATANNADSDFQNADVNRDGVVNAIEFRQAMQGEATKWQMTEGEINEIFTDIDRNGDLRLTLQEAREAYQRWQQQEVAEYRTWFQNADRDRNNQLNLQETISAAMVDGYNDQEIRQWFQASDTSRNQQLSFDEFMNAPKESQSQQYQNNQYGR